MKANSFDVLRIMSERNLDIRLAPMSNLLRAQKVKAGTQLTFGAEGDLVSGIMSGRFVGGVILADSKQYREIELELQGGE